MESDIRLKHFKGGIKIMRYSYACELKFIIPHVKVENGVVSSANYYDFKSNLLKGLEILGLNYFQIVPMKEVIDGIEYDAEQIVVYCGEMMEQAFIQEFWNNCCSHRRDLGINSFYYIQNGVLINLEIGGDEMNRKDGE